MGDCLEMAKTLSDLLGVEVYVDVSIDRVDKSVEYIVEIEGTGYCSVHADDAACYNELFDMVEAIKLYKKIKEGK